MVVLAVVVFGLISYQQLRLNLMPDISYPSLTVRTEYPGTAPEEVETTVSRQIEEALGIVNNLVTISSISKADQSDVKLEFTWDTDMNQAVSEVREKLDQVFLPEEVEPPIILRFDPTLDPIIRLGLYGDQSLIYLRYLGEEEIKRELERIEGVAAIKIKGGLEEEIRVELNEQQLTLIGVDIQQARNRLRQENVNLAGGNLKEGQTEYLVRTLNEFKSIDEVGDVVIGFWNGKEVKIRDVAQVKRTFKEREIITRIDKVESVEIEIFKEADANIVAVAERVRDKIFGSEKQREWIKKEPARQLKAKELTAKEKKAREQAKSNDKNKTENAGQAKEKKKKNEKKGHSAGGMNPQVLMARQMTDFINYDLPEGVKIKLLSDQSVFIQSSVDEVLSTAQIGGILAVVVLFIFLRRISTTLIVGLSIPVSIVATFAPMKIFDVSLNIMSLGGLALGIGMLVDNSIVVLESIARCREEGDDLVAATIRGSGEVGGAVFASTLTTVAVFFPIVFVEGIAGQIFGNLALTVVFSLLASLCVALFVIPMLASRQTTTFVKGVNLKKFGSGNIFFYKNQPEIDRILDEAGSVRGWVRFTAILLEIARTFLFLLLKILLVVGALLATIIKYISLFLLTILSPVFVLLSTLGILKFNAIDRITRLAKSMDLTESLYFAQNVWPTFYCNNSTPTLFVDTKNIFAKISAAQTAGKIFRILVFPIALASVLLKYVLFFIVELASKIIHAALLVGAGKIPGAIILKGLFLVGKLIFTIPVRFFFRAFNWAYGSLESGYPPLLRKTLRNRGVVFGTVSIFFALTMVWIGPKLGSELIPEVRQGEFNLEVTLPVGTPVERTDKILQPLQNWIYDQPEVDKIASVSGTDKSANASSEEGEHTSKLTITMKRDTSGLASEEELIARIRNKAAKYSSVQTKISRPVLFSFRTPIEVQIHGFNLQRLQAYSAELEERMAKIPGVIDVKANIQSGNPEVQIVYNRPVLAQFGLNVMEVASIVRNKIRGDVATEFKEKDRRIDVLVRLREEDKESISDLRRLVINPGAEKPIQLEAVASILVKEGPSEIRRVDQQRTAVIAANISNRSLSEVSADILVELQEVELTDDFTYTLAGQNKEMETSLQSLKMALALAIFLVYIVMASQFESMLHPLMIIFTIPLALIGVVWWLFIFNIPLSIVVFLGLIMLSGIVVNNAIVLVDYINTLRARGMNKIDAIIEGGRVRLRPILMTTATTVLGLLPMALGIGDGAEIRTPMAITVIIGLISATMLTLIIIPTVYSFSPEIKKDTFDDTAAVATQE